MYNYEAFDFPMQASASLHARFVQVECKCVQACMQVRASGKHVRATEVLVVRPSASHNVQLYGCSLVAFRGFEIPPRVFKKKKKVRSDVLPNFERIKRAAATAAAAPVSAHCFERQQ